ncbi:MAG: glycosyltransferase [Chromatiaceae bacterium]|nr:glycosyltransferase [Chromatiaceae bacterium]
MQPRSAQNPSPPKPPRCRLALVVIARNEAATLRACLESARGLVESIILLDTGSSDETVAIAQACGAQVHHFTWCDDVAAARNAALAHSPAAWNLILDADERLADDAAGAEALIEATRGPATRIGLLPVISAFDLEDQVAHSTSWLPRLLPASVRYQGRVHEQPCSELPRVRLPMPIHHSGYRRAALARKHGRNRRLLQAMLEERPEDAYLHYQLGKDDEVYGAFAEAAEHDQRALQWVAPQQGYRHDLVVRLLYVLKRAGQLETAIQLAEQEMPHWQQSPDFFFVLGDLLLDWAIAHPAQAEQEFLPLVDSAWSTCLALGEQPQLEGSVQGRGSFLAAHHLAVLHEQMGRSEQARQYQQLAHELREGQGKA